MRVCHALPTACLALLLVAPAEASGYLTLVKTVQVTPNGNLAGGAGFVHISSLSPDRLLVTFNANLAKPQGDCTNAAHAYLEYTTDLQPTGASGLIACVGGDIGSLLVGDFYYLVSMTPLGSGSGWRIMKYDVRTWKLSTEVFEPLDFNPIGASTELPGDQMVRLLDGNLDVSSQYNATGTMPGFMIGAATHHRFFTTGLQLLERKVLDDTPHINLSSLIEVDGIRYLVSANAFFGDLVVMAYDATWKFLGVKILVRQANMSTGLAWDGQHFFLAYMDTSQRTFPNSLPVSLNVRLSVWNRDWTLLEDIPITSFTAADLRQPGRPNVLLRGNRVYVSYDSDTIDPVTHEERQNGQAYVAVVDAANLQSGTRRRIVRRPDDRCPGGRSPLGVLRSTDHGVSWSSLGNACMQGSAVYAVDPTPLLINGKIALYVVDLDSLGKPVAQRIYLTTSTDGVNFDAPLAAYTQSAQMVDPFVLRMPNGTFRMYVPSEGEGIISAVSSDGVTFTRESGVRTNGGGMPGALALPDGRVRLFVSGNGISSMISSDGVNFTDESGVRIEAPAGFIVDNPEPIRSSDGKYLMLYSVHARRNEGLVPWLHTETRMATSTDGLTWSTDARTIGYGGTSCVIEAPDGTLYLYYVNR